MRWHSHISAEDCQYVWAVVNIDFFVRFVSRAEMVAFFLSEDPKLVPSVQRYIHHSTPRKKLQLSPKIVVLSFFLFVQCSKNAGRRFDSCKSEKSSLRADRERAIIYLRKQRRGSSSHRYGFTFGPTQMLPLSSGYHRPTHFQVRPNQLLKRERQRDSFFMQSQQRLFEGIMIDHEQLNPLVRWRSLTLLSPHREWKAKVFFFFLYQAKGEFCVFFLSPSWYASYSRFRGEYRSVICLKRKSLAGAREDWIKSVLKK